MSVVQNQLLSDSGFSSPAFLEGEDLYQSCINVRLALIDRLKNQLSLKDIWDKACRIAEQRLPGDRVVCHDLTDQVSVSKVSKHSALIEALLLDDRCDLKTAKEKADNFLKIDILQDNYYCIKAATDVLAHAHTFDDSGFLPYKTRSLALRILDNREKNPFAAAINGEFLGDGFNADVYKITVNGEYFAAKVPKKTSPIPQQYEYSNLIKFDKNKHIVKVAHIDANALYLEFLEGTPLHDANVTFTQFLTAAKDMALALQAMHEEGYIHGDVHEDNLFVLNNGHGKLIDLESAEPSSNTSIDVEDFCKSLLAVLEEKYPLEKQAKTLMQHLRRIEITSTEYSMKDIFKLLKR